MNSETSHVKYDLDWEADAVWVQDRSMFVLLEGEDPSNDVIRVTDQLGNQISLNRSELEKTHFLLTNATTYKSRYSPKRAFWPSGDAIVTIGESTYQLAAQDVLMQGEDGRFFTISRHEFNRRYQIVSGAAAKAPFT